MALHELIVGVEAYGDYWVKPDETMQYLRVCQDFANTLHEKIAAARCAYGPTPPSLGDVRGEPLVD